MKISFLNIYGLISVVVLFQTYWFHKIFANILVREVNADQQRLKIVA